MHHRLVSLASASLDGAKGKADDACIQLVSKYRQQKRYISHKCTSIGPLDKCKGAFLIASIIKHSIHVSRFKVSDPKRYFPCATFYSSTPSKRVLSNSASTSFFLLVLAWNSQNGASIQWEVTQKGYKNIFCILFYSTLQPTRFEKLLSIPTKVIDSTNKLFLYFESFDPSSIVWSKVILSTHTHKEKTK